MTSKSLMPPNSRCMKNRWVFKIKCNGVYRACLITCGYSQVPGINFSENYSPVVNDVNLHVLLLMVLHFGYLAKIINVETTFLHGDLEEEIFMECPQGMSNIKKDNYIILNKCIYGLVQVAWQYYKKAIEILKNSDFIGGTIDPCLYVKKSAKDVVYVALYVDDNLMIGDITTIDDAIKALKCKGLVLKIVEGLQDYLSCEMKLSEDKKRAMLEQLHLVKNMEKKFGGLVWDIQSHKTSNTPKFLIMRPMVESKKISTEGQQDYCLDIGMLLYLIKHLYPILPMQPGNYLKQMTVQTLQPTRNSYVSSGMCWT